MRQTSFGFLQDYKKEFGGSLLEGRRKLLRPLTTKSPIHLILKSCEKGVFSPGNTSLLELIREQAKKFNIKIYDLALNWSHIHMVIKIENRKDYVRFIRALTAIIVIRIRQSRPRLKTIFTLRPYTRIVTWGRDLKKVLDYVLENQLEAWGLLRREKKKMRSGRSTS